MSFDFDLIDRNTKEIVVLNRPRFIQSGIIPTVSDDITGKLVKVAQGKASINITYNYSHYFYEATDGDERFAHTNSGDKVEYGIRGLCGKSALESILMLKDMIARITEKYQDKNKNWLITKRKRIRYLDRYGKEILNPGRYILSDVECTKIKEEYEVSEGDTHNYWEATAANAIEALWNMIFIATDQMLNEDAVWNI